jgi:NAD(P)-dependent dehydrogenase (short-subunit alcohol dehydrogenase family)
LSKGTVLISGAAGGIGSATVDRFLSSGYAVAGVDISPTVETLRTGDYRGKVADVTDAEGLVVAVAELLEGMELRHVVGLAGGVVHGEPGSAEPDDAAAVDGFSRSLSLNLIGQYALIQAALPQLSESTGDRSITLCSSVNALRGYGAPGYSAAKAGLIGMTHVLATPLGRRGIRINVVAPGTTRTPPVEEEMRAAKDHARLDRMARQIPLGRVAESDDVAAVIESLADRMTYVNDEVIRIDGGQLLAQPVGPSPSLLRRWLHNRPFR